MLDKRNPFIGNLATGLQGLAYEGVSSHLNKKREGTMKKAYLSKKSNQNLHRYGMYNNSNEVILCGTCHVQALDDIIHAIQRMNNSSPNTKRNLYLRNRQHFFCTGVLQKVY